jgi:hypothetical protein
MVTAIVILVVRPRVPREDEMMARGIGKEWEEWAQRIKYRLIPGVYQCRICSPATSLSELTRVLTIEVMHDVIFSVLAFTHSI